MAVKLKVNAQLGKARQAVAKAEAELRTFVREEWPVGSEITFIVRNTITATGVVLAHNSKSILVRRDDGHKSRYWIDLKRIVC